MQAIAAEWEAEAAEAEAAEAEAAVVAAAAQEEAAVAEAAQPANWHTQAIPLGLHGDAVHFAHAVPKSAKAAAKNAYSTAKRCLARAFTWSRNLRRAMDHAVHGSRRCT